MDSAEFKYAFLRACAGEGMTLAQSLERTKSARLLLEAQEKGAGVLMPSFPSLSAESPAPKPDVHPQLASPGALAGTARPPIPYTPFGSAPAMARGLGSFAAGGWGAGPGQARAELPPSATMSKDLVLKQGWVKRANPTLAAGAGSFLGPMAKGIFVDTPRSILSSSLPTLLSLGGLLAVGAPIAAGAAAGTTAAHAGEDDTNIEEAKARELVSEYHRQADKAQHERALRRLAGRF